VEIRWTRKALENLDQIAAYIAQDNPTRAGSFVGEIKEKN
jgi:plasmid stabilization system protein ParE